MRENGAKRKLERGERVVCVSGLNSTHVIDFLGQFGFDAVWIEAGAWADGFRGHTGFDAGVRCVGDDFGGAGESE